MGFTLRFMLGFALVLATCSVLECASSWRHIRQAPPLEDLPEASILEDRISNLNESRKEEIISNNNASNKTANDFKAEVVGQSLQTAVDNQKADNESVVENKPKTETNTEKHTRDNKINVHTISSVSNNTKVDKEHDNINVPSEKVEKIAEASLEKPTLKDINATVEAVQQNDLKNESQKVKDEQKATTEKVPEIKPVSSAARVESARSLDIDINKYVSPEFHSNVYSFSVSPDTEKYTNLHNELPKSTTSRLQTQESSKVIFGTEHTTPLDEDFDKKIQHIEEAVKQKLEYIDHQFPDTEHDFKKPEEDETVHIDKLLDEPKSNGTTVNLNYIKFKNITDNYARDKNKIHKELDVESGQNIDFSSSFNRTQIYDQPPKDYKNKIPTHEEDLKPDIPEHSEAKIHKTESKEVELEAVNDKIPEINFKESTSLTKPPSLNKTENHKSLLSNNIETEVPNPAENNMKVEWDFPYSSTTSTTQATAQSSSTVSSGQEEKASYVPYGKENLINVSKRGSTKYVDTIKVVTTTESMVNKIKNRPSTTLKSKVDLANKQALANKENKTIEQAVLENQVYPVQIPAPNKDSKEEKIINDTTEKSVTTENAVLPLKLYTISHTSSPAPISGQKLANLPIHAEVTTVTENDNSTTSEAPEVTTYGENNSFEVTTIVTTENAKQELVTETTTTQAVSEYTTTSENLTIPWATEATISITAAYTTTLETETETSTTNLVTALNEFTTAMYEIDTSGSTEDGSDSSQTTVNSETASSSEEVVVENTYPSSSEFQEYPDSNTTVSSYEDSVSTSVKSDEYSETDERINNGRELKTNSSETTFSSTGLDYQTIEDNSNNLDLNSVPTTTTERNLNSTTEHVLQINKTNETMTPTTSDYRENIINKQPDSTGTTKRPEEASHELVSKHNLTGGVNEDEGIEDETEDELDPEVGDNYYTTLRPRMVKPLTEDNSSETTPLIIPLNVSMLEGDTTDSTTADNLGLDSDDKVEGNGGQIAAIVISCIGAACLIILAGLLFIMRKRHKRFNYGQRCTPVSLDAYSVDNVSVYNSMRRKGAMRASKRSYGNPAFEDPSSTTHSVNFPALAKFANNSEGISTEFEEIPQVTAQMNELPEGCETKNRYANVIPLPETRVFLNVIEGYPNSDYMNANYVTGPKSIRGYYIACQAPMQSTVDDFWRMVWEQQSKVILMLTHLFENGTEKCVDYLPPSEVLDCHRLFGDFQVTLKKREVKEKYVISILQLKNMVSNSWREVTHLWYLGWPEKGVPSEANSLIAFLIEARSYIKAASPVENGKPKETSSDQTSNGSVQPEQSPVIVHCSPGTGRTGTVIACDIAIREFELARQVDIPKTVYRIRRDRASSVQTKEQYAFIYKVISLYATKLTGGVLDSL